MGAQEKKLSRRNDLLALSHSFGGGASDRGVLAHQPADRSGFDRGPVVQRHPDRRGRLSALSTAGQARERGGLRQVSSRFQARYSPFGLSPPKGKNRQRYDAGLVRESPYLSRASDYRRSGFSGGPLRGAAGGGVGSRHLPPVTSPILLSAA